MAEDFFILSRLYVDKTDKNVLISRGFIIQAINNKGKIPKENRERLIKTLQRLGVASSPAIIRHTLRMYRLTRNALQGIEKDRKYLEHLEGTSDGWLAAPYRCLLKDGLTWKKIQEIFNRGEIEKAIADAISIEYTASKQPPDLPDYLEQAAQSLLLQFRGRLSNLAGIIERCQGEKCATCEKARSHADYLDQLTACQNELRLRDGRIEELEKKLAEKDAELRNIKDRVRALADE